jgi:hypothetical protein
MLRVTARCDVPHTWGPPPAGQVQLVGGAIARQEEARTSGTGGRWEAGSLETVRKSGAISAQDRGNANRPGANSKAIVNTVHVNPTSTSVRVLRAAIHAIYASVIRRITGEPVNTLTSRAAASPIDKVSTFTRRSP